MKRRLLRIPRAAAPRGSRSVHLVGVAAVAAAVLTLSACQVMSPIQTNVPYQSAEGVSVDLGALQIRDLVIVTDAKGSAGVLSGLAINSSADPVTVTFATGPTAQTSARAVIPAGTPTRLSGVEGEAPVTIPSLPAAPGDVVTMVISTPDAGAPTVPVPVLPPTGYYSSITPAPAPLQTIGP